MDQVTQILNQIDLQESEGKKAINVDHIHESTVQIDFGHLMLQDQNELGDMSKEQLIQDRARDLTQLFINRLWTLERDAEDKDLIPLPEIKMRLPRNLEYVQRPESKWEKFAKKKGIVKKKKDSLVWDEQDKEWKPRFGYRGINQKQKLQNMSKGLEDQSN